MIVNLFKNSLLQEHKRGAKTDKLFLLLLKSLENRAIDFMRHGDDAFGNTITTLRVPRSPLLWRHVFSGSSWCAGPVK